MKRSRQVIMAQMRKSWRVTTPAVTVAAIVLVTGCSDNKEMSIYSSVDDCINENPEHSAQCRAAYQDALATADSTAPKYRSRAECGAEFGSDSCVQSSQNNWFMPAMAGFMFGQIINNRSYNQPLFSSTNPRSRYYGGWASSDGYSYGKKAGRSKVLVPSEHLKAKPAVTRTISRGGFGSKAAAKSSWSRSSSKSWGG